MDMPVRRIQSFGLRRRARRADAVMDTHAVRAARMPDTVQFGSVTDSADSTDG